MRQCTDAGVACQHVRQCTGRQRWYGGDGDGGAGRHVQQLRQLRARRSRIIVAPPEQGFPLGGCPSVEFRLELNPWIWVCWIVRHEDLISTLLRKS